jgi:hypothetical protein
MNDSLSPFCVYTIRHSRELNKIMAAGGSAQHTEKKRWTGAQGLLDAARKTGRHLPVIFAGAETIEGLIYWAIVSDIQIDDRGPFEASTTMTFTGMKRLPSKPPLCALRLRSSGQPLSNSYIRPYAICHTPAFLA